MITALCKYTDRLLLIQRKCRKITLRIIGNQNFAECFRHPAGGQLHMEIVGSVLGILGKINLRKRCKLIRVVSGCINIDCSVIPDITALGITRDKQRIQIIELRMLRTVFPTQHFHICFITGCIINQNARTQNDHAENGTCQQNVRAFVAEK